MAILTDSFDGYNGLSATNGVQSRWLLNASGNFSLVSGRFSGQALRWVSNSTTPFAQLAFGASYAAISVGFAIYWESLPTVNGIGVHMMFYEAGGATQCGLRVNTDGSFTIRRMSTNIAGTDLYTSPAGVFVAAVWYYMEIELVVNDTTGSFKVYINGALIGSVTSADTKNSTTSTVSSIALGQTNPSDNNQGTARFDDFAFNDSSTRLGEARIDILRPSADTGTKTWTPDTGSVNYSRVNETLIDVSNYVSTSTVNNRDLYDFDNLSITPVTIYAVTVICFAKKTDATTRVLQCTIQSNAVDAVGSDHYLGTSDQPHASTYLLNPDGNVAWTKAAVDALKAGPKLAA